MVDGILEDDDKARELGFNDAAERKHMCQRAWTETLEDRQAFEVWSHNDRTRAGLIKLKPWVCGTAHDGGATQCHVVDPEEEKYPTRSRGVPNCHSGPRDACKKEHP